MIETSMLALLLALALDHLLGEARHLHPLVGFGHFANFLEKNLNKNLPIARFGKGIIAWCILTLPVAWLAYALRPEGNLSLLWDAMILYFCIGLRSLREHTTPIAMALDAHPADAQQRLENARQLTGYIVSRDTETLDETQCARAAIESLLENGNDALFATLFWYLILGPAGAVLHRSVNTLDALWGYHTPRYEWFGKGAARADDLMGYIPARLTAWGYALAGNVIRSLRCWRLQSHFLASPNGSPCMTAGAGSLGVTLGGPCRYHGKWTAKPFFGEGPPPEAHDIYRAQQLITHTLLLWLIVLYPLYALDIL